MDDVTLIAAVACVLLAALVYLMWRAATKPEWHEFAQSEKRDWRNEEEKIREGKK